MDGQSYETKSAIQWFAELSSNIKYVLQSSNLIEITPTIFYIVLLRCDQVFKSVWSTFCT